MGKPNYAQMDLNNLFAALEVAAINEHEVFVRGGPERIKLQHKWVAVYNEICEDIQSRGDAALQRYVPLLAAEHPAVRLAAALGLRKTAPNLVIPVLEELSCGKYPGVIGMDARMTLDAMRQNGQIAKSSTYDSAADP